MKRTQVILLLKKAFPNITGIRVGEDLGYTGNCIHLGDVAEGGTINDIPACDYYSFELDPKEKVYIMGIHRKLYSLLDKCGWHAECHDPGTYHAFEN